MQHFIFIVILKGDLIMTKNVFEPWTAWGENSFKTLQKLGELNLRISEKLLKEQMELTNHIIEASSKSMEAAGKSKDIQEVLSNQATVAQECGEEIMKCYSCCADTLEESRKEYNELFEEGLKTAGENFDKTTSKKKAA